MNATIFFPLIFCCFYILRKAIQQLLEEGDLGDATEIILGGCSAGAVAAVVLGDQIAQMVREVATRRGASARM